MVHAGYPQKQAVAASLSNARRHPRADGGGIADEMQQPEPEAAPADGTSGLLHSAVAGRTDHLQVETPAGAYVIPADIVSGIGEGNTMAGARLIQHLFVGAPYGVQAPKGKPHHTIPRPPGAHRAAGGAAEKVPILGAGGEYILHPRDVARLGGGDVKRGHRILDAWVVHERKKIVATMKKLPGPVRGKS